MTKYNILTVANKDYIKFLKVFVGSCQKNCTNLDELYVADIGLGSTKKQFNDVTFIDEFFTEDFCEDQRYYTYALNPRTNKYEIKTRDWREVKEEVLTSITNGGNPVIEVLDGNFHNRGELLLQHRYQGRELDLQYARFTLANLSRLWGRPANVATIVEGEKKVYCYKNGDFYEEKTGEKADKQTQKPESKGRSK